jgi:hypothetical protein
VRAARVAQYADERKNMTSPPNAAWNDGKRGTSQNSAREVHDSQRISARAGRVSFQLIGAGCNGILR